MNRNKINDDGLPIPVLVASLKLSSLTFSLVSKSSVSLSDYVASMLYLFSLNRFHFKWRFARTCYRYSDGTMSTTDKVDEQISDASKPQKNGHERNKSEELQLEDINDNNNDEVIFRDIFSRVGAEKSRRVRSFAWQLSV